VGHWLEDEQQRNANDHLPGPERDGSERNLRKSKVGRDPAIGMFRAKVAWQETGASKKQRGADAS